MRILWAVMSLMEVFNHSRSRRRKEREDVRLRSAAERLRPEVGECTIAAKSDDKEKTMGRESVQTAKAPQAIGPYNQAIKVNGVIYTAGQIPIDPASGNFVEGGIREQ